MNICLIGESAISPPTLVQVCDWLHFWAKKVHRLFGHFSYLLFGQLQLATLPGRRVKISSFHGVCHLSVKHVNLVVKLTDGVCGVSACAHQIRRW